jgi:hypothetical protein
MVTTKTTPSAKKTTTRRPAVKKAATVKTATKTAPRKAPTTRKSAAAPTQAAAKPAVKADKTKKPKLVRDSFTIPKSEYAVIDALKLRSNKLAHPAKKSELLRAGIKALAAMTDIQFKAALAEVPAIKTGRPKTAK